MHHALLVARLVVAQGAGVLLQRLADAGDIAVPENTPAPGEERSLDAVTLDLLLGEEQDERLGHGQCSRCHVHRP